MGKQAYEDYTGIEPEAFASYNHCSNQLNLQPYKIIKFHISNIRNTDKYINAKI